MKHVKNVTKGTGPVRAVDIPVDTKITFITEILSAFAPVLEAKEETSS